MSQEPNIISTGIPGLDEIMHGGFIAGSTILLAGHPGAGKTTFGAMFIYYGATKYGDPGIYLNFNESKSIFYSFMRKFGMDFEKIEKEGKFRYIDALTVSDPKDIDDTIRYLMENIIELDAKRVVIDPISVITRLLSPAKARALIANTIVKILKNLEVTTILIADLPYGFKKVGYGVEEFVSDTVIILHTDVREDYIKRMLEIRKIRGEPIRFGVIPYVILDKGIEVIVPLTLKVEGTFQDEFITTGSPELDNFIGGGVPKNSITAIVGPAGAGKTMIALNLAVKNAERGKKILYLSFTESKEQLLKRLKLLGYDDKKARDFIRIIAVNPLCISENELLLMMRKVLSKYSPDIYIVDALEVLLLALGKKDFINYIYRRVHELKKQGLTVIITINMNYPEERICIDNLVDNLIVIRMHLNENEVQRRLFVWKLRGKKAPSKYAKIIETERGEIKLILPNQNT